MAKPFSIGCKTMNDAALCCPMHIDEDWRLIEGASNPWIGTVEDMTGKEIMNLSAWAVKDFEGAYNFARYVVSMFNNRVLGLKNENNQNGS